MRKLVFGMVVVCAIGFLGGRASAGGAPTLDPLVYAGVLTDGDGGAMAKSKSVQVLLFDVPTDNGAAPKCSSDPVQTEAGTGRFEVTLPTGCAAAVHANADLWVEIAVAAGSGKVALPRVKLGSVPYALEATKAMTADGASGPLASTLAGIQESAAKAAKQADLDALLAQVASVQKDLAAIKSPPTAKNVKAFKVNISGSPSAFQTAGGTLVLVANASCQGTGSVWIDASSVGSVTGTAGFVSFVIGPLAAGSHTIQGVPFSAGNYCSGSGTMFELP